jgi:hypothetical protein
MMDFLDDLLGPLNYWDRIVGLFQIATRRGSRRRKQRYSRTEMVRVAIPYSDRTPGIATPQAIRNHLHKYGVDTYGYTHDANHWYASVPRRQYKWFQRLYNGGALWTPASAWKERRIRH